MLRFIIELIALLGASILVPTLIYLTLSKYKNLPENPEKKTFKWR